MTLRFRQTSTYSTSYIKNMHTDTKALMHLPTIASTDINITFQSATWWILELYLIVFPFVLYCLKCIMDLINHSITLTSSHGISQKSNTHTNSWWTNSTINTATHLITEMRNYASSLITKLILVIVKNIPWTQFSTL